MRARFLPVAVATIMLLAFGAVAAACGGNGDGELTLAEYFERLETLSVRFDDQGNELEEKFDFESAESEEETIDLAQSLFRGGVSVVREFVDGMDDLNPPAEAEDAHSEAVDAGEGAVAAFEDLADRVDDVQSVADLEGVFEDLLAEGGAFERFSQACSALEGIADDNSIAVELRCD